MLEIIQNTDGPFLTYSHKHSHIIWCMEETRTYKLNKGRESGEGRVRTLKSFVFLC